MLPKSDNLNKQAPSWGGKESCKNIDLTVFPLIVSIGRQHSHWHIKADNFTFVAII